MRKLLAATIEEIKDDGLILFFFEDMEQFQAYKPYIIILGVLGLINLIVALACL